MKKYGILIAIVLILCAIYAIRLLTPAKLLVVESATQKTIIYDTIRWVESEDKQRLYRAKNIELNSADSATLVSVYGIGEVFQKRIINYRTKLGGFYTKTQLKEIHGITDEIYQRIAPHFWIDTLAIKKINVNFATLIQMNEHPYFGNLISKRLLKAVKLKGGYSTLQELLEDNILLPKESETLAPYISFSQISN